MPGASPASTPKGWYGHGAAFLNIGSASNACQEENREVGSPGVDPCTELETRAGIWRFDDTTAGQTFADGTRFATGVRNANALGVHPQTGELWAAVNGRDQLYDNWPDLYEPEDEQNLPAEEILRVEEGAQYSWPYCYFDAEVGSLVLAPEYGGDGTEVGRCDTLESPEMVLPSHWAPLGLHFYEGAQFPERYRGGMFVANHGSRFDPQAEEPPGYNVVFIPFTDGTPPGDYEDFATGFAGDARPLPGEAEHRPVGLAEGPDGSLYISDDKGGRIWRVFYVGE